MDASAPSTLEASLAGSITTASGSDIPQMVPASGLSSEGRRKTAGYYWTIRKLNRSAPGEVINAQPRVDAEGQNAVLASVWKRFNLVNRQAGEIQVLHPPIEQIPIRFEWTKDPNARRASRSSRRSSRVIGHGRAATDAVSPAPRAIAARRGSFDIETAVSGNSDRSGGAQPLSERLVSASGAVAPAGSNLQPPSNAGSRPGSIHSARRSMESSALDDTTSSHGDTEEDDGYGSDPEDSETAWSCHLVLGPETRIPIGSLAPAPHHPKIVGQLAIPFPLPDLSASGLCADGAGLSREELKDIVCTTCFFLTIREGWGGIGNRKRKGDSGLRMAAAQHMRPI
ncbi:hypothetical protein CBOM_00839 [Ceraceosorus bombacis]|uniref:Uncharacterized protein n=1 Tax=Ceraceosorus bombacis TaxID=401625 RepID=A0A0P1BA50_9BASI|nr:hypothetical protein CBOM_00839 [Ceraceosorus bombacis]